MNKEQNTQVILHIGLHKTGTTFLQQEIFPKLKGVNYKIYYEMQDYKIKDGAVNLISCENLSGSLLASIKFGAFERNALLYGMKALYPNARIIVGFRDKKAWLYSVYCQHIKQGRLYRSYNAFLRTIPAEYIDFNSYECLICELFDDVYVYYFEAIQKDVDGFVRDICDFIGVPVPIFVNKKFNKAWGSRKLLLGKIRSFVFIYSRKFLEKL